ncbi:unnamed protein product [Camellia sinensis]
MFAGLEKRTGERERERVFQKKGRRREEGRLEGHQDLNQKLWKNHLKVIRRMTKFRGVCLESVLDSQPMCLPWRFRS